MRPRVMAAVALAGLLPPMAAAEDLAAIRQRGVLRVLAVLQTPTPEFFSVDPAQPPGFDREVLDAFGRAQGVKVEFVPLATWDQLVPALLEGRGDLVGGRVSHTADRAKRIDFTTEVFPTRDVVFNYGPATPVTTREQLLSLPRLATLRGSSMAESIRGAGVPESRIAYPAPPESMPDRVRAGEFPAGVWALEAAMVWQRRQPELQIGMFVGEPQSLAYGVPKDAPQLLAALNGHIRLVKESGTWNRLVVKYFGSGAPDILKRARDSH